MKNKPYISTRKMNNQGIAYLLIGFISWVIVMKLLNVF
jgi:hypothetical protein